MVEYTIRPMKPEDAAEVAKMHSASIKEIAIKGEGITQEMVDIWGDVSAKGHIESLEKEDKFVLIVDGVIAVTGSTLKEKQVVHKITQQILEPNTFAIAMLYTNPQYAGHGYGAIMLEYLENYLLSLGTQHIILESSTFAERFYTKHGYKSITKINHPLRNGKVIVPAIVMTKQI